LPTIMVQMLSKKANGELKEGSRIRWASMAPSEANLFQQCPAQRGLAGAHGTDDDIEPPLESKGQFELLQTVHMLSGLEKKIRIRGVGKGLAIQVE
jgi:hypothetical protein